MTTFFSEFNRFMPLPAGVNEPWAQSLNTPGNGSGSPTVLSPTTGAPITPTTNTGGLYALMNQRNPHRGMAERIMAGAQQPGGMGINFAAPLLAYMAGKSMKEEGAWDKAQEGKAEEYQKRLDAGEKEAKKWQDFERTQKVLEIASKRTADVFSATLQETNDHDYAANSGWEAMASTFREAGFPVPENMKGKVGLLPDGRMELFVVDSKGTKTRGFLSKDGNYAFEQMKDGKWARLSNPATLWKDWEEADLKEKELRAREKAAGPKSGQGKPQQYVRTEGGKTLTREWASDAEAYQKGYNRKLIERADGTTEEVEIGPESFGQGGSNYIADKDYLFVGNKGKYKGIQMILPKGARPDEAMTVADYERMKQQESILPSARPNPGAAPQVVQRPWSGPYIPPRMRPGFDAGLRAVAPQTSSAPAGGLLSLEEVRRRHQQQGQ